MANIIIRKYEGYNRAMGKYIKSKRHYEEEMRKGGYVTEEKGRQMAEKRQHELRQEYKLTKKAQSVIENAKNHIRKDGLVHPSDKLIEGMKEVGINYGNLDTLNKMKD